MRSECDLTQIITYNKQKAPFVSFFHFFLYKRCFAFREVVCNIGLDIHLSPPFHYLCGCAILCQSLYVSVTYCCMSHRICSPKIPTFLVKSFLPFSSYFSQPPRHAASLEVFSLNAESPLLKHKRHRFIYYQEFIIRKHLEYNVPQSWTEPAFVFKTCGTRGELSSHSAVAGSVDQGRQIGKRLHPGDQKKTKKQTETHVTKKTTTEVWI